MKISLHCKKLSISLWLPVSLACRAVKKWTKTGRSETAWREIVSALKTCPYRGELLRFERGDLIISVRR